MDLAPTLKKHFGYDEFRPLQQKIINDALAGRDVLVLMPTGGGKSLCFQLPALTRDGLTVVVSPLIALMKDNPNAHFSPFRQCVENIDGTPGLPVNSRRMPESAESLEPIRPDLTRIGHAGQTAST